MPTSRIKTYIPLVQTFSSRVVFFHSAVAQKLGIHLTDLKSIHLLCQVPMTPRTLGKEVGLSGPAVTALVDRLEKQSFVVRKRDSADRRSITLHVVPGRLAEIDLFYKGQYARMSKILATFSEGEFLAIQRFLGQTSEILLEEADDLMSSHTSE